MALALAAAGATGGLGSAGSKLLQQGLKTLGSSPELEKLADTVRYEVLEVGKTAVRTAASRQIDSLTSRLHDRAESLRTPGGLGRVVPEEEEEPVARRRPPSGRTRPAREEPEEEEGYEEGYEAGEEFEEEEEPRARRRPAGRTRPARREREPEEEEEEEEEGYEEVSEREATRHGGVRRESTSSRDRPVRRAGR
ncbi:hypothetical protein [Streptosporangium sp. NPDC001681]|uniref:hypothetical protein n=1 Tax=Streptosporangium sp. NPDC001681 TaxID=3154395 RepID=UPI00332D5F1B